MAEGEEISVSTVDGSDIVFEFECTPCAVDGSRHQALQFCQTCKHYLCDTCIKYHQRFTKRHQIGPAGSAKHSNVQAKSKNKLAVDKCYYHPDRDIEMYCGTHDMVYCSLCIAKEHRSCNNVEEVEDEAHKSDIFRLQQLVVYIDRVYEELSNTKRDKSDSLKVIKAKKIDLLKEIANLRTEINDHLDKLENQIKAELNEVLTKLEKDLHDDIVVADELLITASAVKQYLAGDDDDKNSFIVEKIGAKVVSDASAYLAKADPSEQINAKFQCNALLYENVMMSDSLGRIVTNSSKEQLGKRSRYVVKSCDKINLKVSTDKATLCVIGMCQLQSGTVLIIDSYNKNLKRLDEQLNVTDVCDCKSLPCGICSISSTEVAVRYEESIQFIHDDEPLSLGKKIQIRKRFARLKSIRVRILDNYFGNCIALCADNLWTFDEKNIFVYSTSGELVTTIDSYSPDRNLFSGIGIAVGNDGSKVYITTGEDRVLVFNTTGDVVSELRDQRLNGAGDVCVTEDDILLVAGFNSKNVVMFDRDGYCLGELLSSQDMLFRPRAMCYDRKKCRLLVGYRSDTIQVFELSS